MPATLLTTATINRNGVEPEYEIADLVNGNEFVNTGKEFIIVSNEGGTFNLTIVTPVTQDGLAVADRVVAIPGEDDLIGPFPVEYRGWQRIIGPFPTGIYNNASGRVQLNYGAGADTDQVIVLVVKLP